MNDFRFTPTVHTALPTSIRHSPNVGLMLGQRRRRWANIKPTLGEYIVLVE